MSGDVALIGAPLNDVGATVDQGSAYVFTRSGAVLIEEVKLTDGGGAADDHFGNAVALSGAAALVGSYEDDAAEQDQGSAFAFADVVAPVTTASLTPAPNAAGWNRAPVTVALAAGDVWPGVATTFCRLGDTGDYAVYDDGAKPVVSTDGVTRVWYYSTDLGGTSETPRTTTVRVDTTRPSTRALAKATVTRGKVATLRLRVNDAVSPKATVTVKIYRSGALKKTLKLGLRKTNAEIRYRFTCKLGRGTYVWKVYATDLAGNRQGKVGYNKLVVR